MRMANHADLLEHFERAIHRGYVDGRRLTAYLCQDFVGSGVAEVLDRAEDQFALRSEAVAASAQPRLPIGRLGIVIITAVVVLMCRGWVAAHAR